MAQTLTRLLVHVVFSTKGREPLIPPEIENDLYKYLAGISRNHDSPLLAVGGTADHVHLLVALSKNVALSALLMHLKKDSSKWIKTRSPRARAFAWQEGYGAFTLGASQVPAATRYIAGQKEHHRRRSFQDELRTLCRKYDVALDEQHAWT
ncbi:MAG: IS200/IS605 family transposase [Phycisphaerales bacterium]